MTTWSQRLREFPCQVRRLFRELRVENDGPVREAAAIGFGLFVGCLPFYGFHLFICWMLGPLLRLNRLKASLASNISNPLIAPWLILAELQTGEWLRHGSAQRLTIEAVRAVGLRNIGIDLLAGSIVVGVCVGTFGTALTYRVLRPSGAQGCYVDVMRLAAGRYEGSILAWELARARFRNDPIYSAALNGHVFQSGDVLVDLGCGPGFMLALLAEAQRLVRAGEWPPSLAEPPRFERLIGVEPRPRTARAAAEALGDDAAIIRVRPDDHVFQQARVVLLLDVLCRLARREQDALLRRLGDKVRDGSVVLVREVDAAAGWRSSMARAATLLRGAARGDWRPRHFRTHADWMACFKQQGFDVEMLRLDTSLRATSPVYSLRTAAGPGSTVRHEPAA